MGSTEKMLNFHGSGFKESILQTSKPQIVLYIKVIFIICKMFVHKYSHVREVEDEYFLTRTLGYLQYIYIIDGQQSSVK